MHSRYQMGENHQQQHEFNNNNGENIPSQVFSVNQYIFQDVYNNSQTTTQDFLHHHHHLHHYHFQALLQQQRNRLLLHDEHHSVLRPGGGGGGGGAASASVMGNNIRPPAQHFPLNFKPKDVGLNDADAAMAMPLPHYCWQNQEDSGTNRQPFWKHPCTDLISDGSNDKTKDKEMRPEMNNSLDDDQNGKSKLLGELEAICRNASIASEANGNVSGAASAVTLGDLNSNAGGATAAAAIGDGHDGSETFSGEEETEDKQIKKRKRLKDQLSSMAAFFERLVHQLMEHQENLHKNFMEAIERLDKERKEREEVWRRQELEKFQQDAAAKAHERALASSREASIVSYMEKITGQTIKLPCINPPSDFNQDAISSRAAINAGDDSGTINTSNKRWPKVEVEALIQIRSSLEQKFQEPGSKGILWEEISNSMASMGYQRSAKRCKEKWENINKYFKKSRENPKQCRKKLKTCQYFDQLDQLYSKSVLVNGSSYSFSSSSEHQAKPNDENLLPKQIEGLDVPAGNADYKSNPSMDFNEEEGDGIADYPDEGE